MASRGGAGMTNVAAYAIDYQTELFSNFIMRWNGRGGDSFRSRTAEAFTIERQSRLRSR